MSVRIIQGDVRERLAELPADYFDCIVTSPPYFGLRDYGTVTWEGGDPGCDHSRGSFVSPSSTLRSDGRDHTGPYDGEKAVSHKMPFRDSCGKCGARRIDAQIGLEPTLNAYLETMVAVCRELRRVLKPSGVFFCNIGDSYATGTSSTRKPTQSGKHGYWENPAINLRIDGAVDGLKPKDLCLVPERLGIALQADGWWVRSHIIWSKKNPMPESCTDRPTSAHETIWMLTKSARYFYDVDAVREPQQSLGKRHEGKSGYREGHPSKGGISERKLHPGGANIRNVWDMASHPYPGAHFATFPPELAERCIKAGSSEHGCCPACGAPWVRIVELGEVQSTGGSAKGARAKIEWRGEVTPEHQNHSMFSGEFKQHAHITKGWSPPACKGRVCSLSVAAPVPARILDPFAGAGTTGLVADRLGRDCTLIDLNTEYAEMALNRIKDDCPMFVEVAAE